MNKAGFDAVYQLLMLDNPDRWPTVYWRDTLIDLAVLADDDAPEYFVYVLRSRGTHIIRPTSDSALDVAEVIRRDFEPEQRWFWFDGSTLEETGFIEVRERLEEICDA